MAITSFASVETELIFNGQVSRRLPREIQATALRKLRQLDAAADVLDLRQPAGNNLEMLSGDRVGQHSIRINRQWRICFVWNIQTLSAENVEIVDYH